MFKDFTEMPVWQKAMEIAVECFPLLAIAGSQQKKQRYKIAVCDWMILKRQKIGSFQLVHELNGDGVELDMGGLGKREMFDNKLREPHFQQLFRETAQKYQLEVSSIDTCRVFAPISNCRIASKETTL